MSTSYRYINHAFESRKLEYLTRIETIANAHHTNAHRMRLRQSFTDVRDKLARRMSDLTTDLLRLPRENHPSLLLITGSVWGRRFVKKFTTAKWPKFPQNRYRADARESSLFLSAFSLSLLRSCRSYRLVYGERKNSPKLPKRSFSAFPHLPIFRRRCALEIFLRRFSHRRDANSRGNKGLEFHESFRIYT